MTNSCAVAPATPHGDLVRAVVVVVTRMASRRVVPQGRRQRDGEPVLLPHPSRDHRRAGLRRARVVRVGLGELAPVVRPPRSSRPRAEVTEAALAAAPAARSAFAVADDLAGSRRTGPAKYSSAPAALAEPLLTQRPGRAAYVSDNAWGTVAAAGVSASSRATSSRSATADVASRRAEPRSRPPPARAWPRTVRGRSPPGRPAPARRPDPGRPRRAGPGRRRWLGRTAGSWRSVDAHDP